MTPLQTLFKLKAIAPSTVYNLFCKENQMLTIDTFKEIVRFYLKVDLSEEEVSVLQSTIIAFYGPQVTSGGKAIQMNRDTFADLMRRDFKVKNLDKNIATTAKQVLTKIRMALKTKAQLSKQSLESMLAPYLMAEPLPSGQQKVISIRSLKVFLMVVAMRSLNAQEVETAVIYLDHSQSGFIGVIDFDKELQFTQ